MQKPSSSWRRAAFRWCVCLKTPTECAKNTSSFSNASEFLSRNWFGKIDFGVYISDMTNKQIVEDLLQRIPEGTSLQDIDREIEFIAAERQGLAEIDSDEHIPIYEVERDLPSRIIKLFFRPL